QAAGSLWNLPGATGCEARRPASLSAEARRNGQQCGAHAHVASMESAALGVELVNHDRHVAPPRQIGRHAALRAARPSDEDLQIVKPPEQLLRRLQATRGTGVPRACRAAYFDRIAQLLDRNPNVVNC